MDKTFDADRSLTEHLVDEYPELREAATSGDAERASAEIRATVATFSFPTLRSANIARQREWDAGNQLTLAYRGNELAGEVGEACNIVKKIERERLGIAGSHATVEQLAEELADVIICCDLLAMDCGIDLDDAVRAKFNKTSENVGLKTRLAS